LLWLWECQYNDSIDKPNSSLFIEGATLFLYQNFIKKTTQFSLLTKIKNSGENLSSNNKNINIIDEGRKKENDSKKKGKKNEAFDWNRMFE
jgi:hypothetical protein